MSVNPGPWGSPGGGGGPRRPLAPPPRVSSTTPGQQLVWNLISSLLLLALLYWLMGPYVAIGGLVGVLVHELGHVLAMNLLGCGPARMVIIPFFGGMAIPARPPSTEFKDVMISLAGPVIGLAAMVPFVALAFATNNPEWFKACFFIALINLLNLVPAPPLDGSKAIGPVLARIHPNVERGVLVAIGAALIYWAVTQQAWITAAFIAFGVFTALRNGPLRPPAIRLSGAQFAVAIALYMAAAILCLGALAVSLMGLGHAPTLGSVAKILGLA